MNGFIVYIYIVWSGINYLLHAVRPFLEQVAAFSHTVEQVETCAAGTQQHGVAGMGKGAAGKDAAADAVGVADGQSAVLEEENALTS